MRLARTVALYCRILCVAGALALSGCATSRFIDTEVTSFASPELLAASAQPRSDTSQPAAATSTSPSSAVAGPPLRHSFSFERLPLQAPHAQHDALEQLARQLLIAAGWTYAPQDPAYVVQIESQLTRLQNYNPPPFMGVFRSNGDPAHGILMIRPMLEPPWFRYEVHVLIRQRIDARVVLESTGIHESPWLDREQVFPAVLAAALNGFPQIPLGRRKITTELKLQPDTASP